MCEVVSPMNPTVTVFTGLFAQAQSSAPWRPVHKVEVAHFIFVRRPDAGHVIPTALHDTSRRLRDKQSVLLSVERFLALSSQV